MTTESNASRVAALSEEADRALARGNVRAARDGFIEATHLAPDQLQSWLGLAACQRALGDPAGALFAIDGALKTDPRCFAALLMKGSLLEALGQPMPAATAYGNALKVAPPSDALAEPMRRALQHAAQVRDIYAEGLAAKLRAAVGLSELSAASMESRRIDTFIEAIVGRRKIFQQEPVEFHYPGMPAIEFHDRTSFPWLEEVERHTDAIRAEAQAVLQRRSADLVPYVNYPDSMPLDQWTELNRSHDWSAFHLLLNGAAVEANCRQCPSTMKALEIVDRPHVANRSPAAMFSILKPRTRIPPHTGVANTRLVLHLPLIVPDGCGFRVGGEIRHWREGEAWVFDDTIEHEAWNDSDLPRTILICDVWSPALSAHERELISLLLAEMDRFNGEAPTGGIL